MKKSNKEAEVIASEPTTKEEIKEASSINPQKKGRKGLIAFLILIILIPALGIGGLFGYQYFYQDKVYEGVSVGPYSVGGMTKQQVAELFDNLNKKYQEEGVILNVTTASGTTKKIPFKMKVNTGDNQLEVASFDSKNLAEYAFAVGRSSDITGAFRDMIFAYINKATIASNQLSLHFNNEIFNDVARDLLAAYENPSENAGITVLSLSPFTYDTTPEKTGSNFDYETLSTQIKERLYAGSFDPIDLAPVPSKPEITQSDVTAAAPTIPNLLVNPVFVVYEDATSTIFQKWKLSPEQISKWLAPIKLANDSVSFAVNQNSVKEYFEANISKYVNRQARNAVFRMENDRVVEFKGSVVGQSVDYELSAARINDVLKMRANGDVATSTFLAIKTVEPEITVGEANNLGITDVVGVGYSSFKGSPTNRIKNIARAVKLLNGVIIKPGENFSTLDNLAPFTSENGYLPELVIKGREIKPELGGGLCQISTTLFRTAMNSAMPIVQRAAHGLVVSYYSDSRNGNPGTDATIYEPIHDFKFENDTGHPLLLQTEIDYTNQYLTFTLWGKPDGRKGSYTAPIVLSRSGAGPAQIVPDPKLPPGTRRCQNAFGGASTEFTYTRILPNGEKIDRVFQSQYRAQPAICFVGVEDAPQPDPGLLVDAPVVDELAPVN